MPRPAPDAQAQPGSGSRADVGTIGSAAASAGAFGQIADGLCGLVLEVAVHAAHGLHARALVDALLHIFGRRDGVDDEVNHRQAVLGEVILDTGLETGAQLIEVARKVEHRLQALAQDVGQTAYDDPAEKVLDLAVGEDAPGAHDLDHEQLGIGDLEGVDPV